MSASREKKQRQSDLDSLTEKQKKDRQEAAAQKRKATIAAKQNSKK